MWRGVDVDPAPGNREIPEAGGAGHGPNGFVQVDSSNFSGWMQKALVGAAH